MPLLRTYVLTKAILKRDSIDVQKTKCLSASNRPYVRTRKTIDVCYILFRYIHVRCHTRFHLLIATDRGDKAIWCEREMQKEVHKVEKTKKYSELFIETCTTVGSTNKNKDACLGGELLPPAGPTLFPSHQKIISIMLFDQSSSVITQPKACYLELFLWTKNIPESKSTRYIWDYRTVQQALGTHWHHISELK